MTVPPPKYLFLLTVSGTIKRIHRMAFQAIVIAFGLWLFSVAVQFAAAQDIFGRIAGTITDSSGGAVPNAQVTITNEATLIRRNVAADKSGYFAADELPAGTYSVTVTDNNGCSQTTCITINRFKFLRCFEVSLFELVIPIF